MTPDHYATLGLSPTAEDVVIHAAYRALIRRYHPDGNASTAAAARSRAINAAYSVLIDPEKRAEYDAMRAAEAWPNAPMQRSVLPAPSRLFAAASVTLLLVLVFLVTWSPLTLVKPPERVAFGPPPAAEAAKETVVPQPTVVPVAPPDAIIAEVANPQLDEPLPLPTPPAVVAAPRLVAQSAAPKPRVARPASPRLAVAAAPAKAVATSSADLANLDRQQGIFYNQSWLRADTAKRARLQTTRDRFIARRDGCRTTACARAAYLAQMREVSEIMIAPVKPPQR